MGKLSEPDSSSSINHFSHQHPLQLCNQLRVPCNGCNLEASGMVYGCPICNYFLHAKCAEMPQQIKHPFDQNHVLSLLPKPIYPEGMFNCDACGTRGNSFSYHCSSCSIDLHIACASLPLDFTHPSHHHKMDLTFSPPYHNKSFSCDICSKPGSKTWLYRCSSCDFDVHLACVTTIRGVQAPIQRNQMAQTHVTSRSLAPEYATGPAAQGVLPNYTAQTHVTSRSLAPEYATGPAAQGVLQNYTPNYGIQAPMQNYPQFNGGYQAANYGSNVGQAQPQFTGNQYGGIAPMQSTMPQNNMTNGAGNGTARNGGNLQTMILGQLVNGIASGFAQGATGAMIQDLTGGGGGGGNNANGTDGGGIAFDCSYSGTDGNSGGIDGGFGSGEGTY